MNKLTRFEQKIANLSEIFGKIQGIMEMSFDLGTDPNWDRRYLDACEQWPAGDNRQAVGRIGELFGLLPPGFVLLIRADCIGADHVLSILAEGWAIRAGRQPTE